MAFSADGKTLVTSSGDLTLRVWDTATGEPRTVMRGHEERINEVALSPDGKLAISGADDNTVRLWDTQSGDPVQVLAQTDWVTGVSFHPDGRSYAFVSGPEIHRQPVDLELWQGAPDALLEATERAAGMRLDGVRFRAPGP